MKIIPINDIISVEYRSRRMRYNLADSRSMEGFSKRESFETLSAPLQDYGCFLKISASHIINMNHVKSLAGKAFIMSNGTSFSITRTYNRAKETFIDFVFKIKIIMNPKNRDTPQNMPALKACIQAGYLYFSLNLTQGGQNTQNAVHDPCPKPAIAQLLFFTLLLRLLKIRLQIL